MSSKEVTQLRKEGKLDEAFMLAQEDYNKEPDNIWNKRALSWVYYDFCKKATAENNANNFLENIQKIKDLQLPSEDKMIFDSLIWEYKKLLENIIGKKIDFQKANKLYQSLKGMRFTLPSKEFSVLITVLHKVYKNNHQYVEIIGKCIKYLRPEDFLPEVYNNRKLMPLAERIYYAYSKKILEGDAIPNQYGIVEYHPNKENIKTFLSTLNHWIEKHPDYTFLPYYKAKLEIALGNTDALSAFLPFAKKKKNDFWVWQLISEIVTEQELVFACLCKALSLKTPEGFLSKIRIELTKKLIEKKLYNEARTEVESVFKEKLENNHKTPNEILKWQREQWYIEAQPLKNNFALYNQYKGKAEVILYNEIPEDTIVITFVNQEKKIANFVKDQKKAGFFKYENFLKNPKIGDILKVRLEVFDLEKNAYKLLTTEKGNEADCKAIKTVEGQLKIISSGIGFVDDVFVDKEAIEKNQWINNQMVKFKSVLSFNKKKGNWCWAFYRPSYQ